ncbi:hypothetical protein EON64_16795, partial [archaeon]
MPSVLRKESGQDGVYLWDGGAGGQLPCPLLDYHVLKSVTDVLPILQRSSTRLSPLPTPLPQRGDVAFLQLTSGSTGSPKGVMIDHNNLACNCCHRLALFHDLQAAYSTRIICITWLPMYHDMGLVLATCGPLYFVGQVHFMPSLDFLADPLSWLDLVSLTRSTLSMAPNFAFNLVNRKWQSARAQSWGLSSLRCLYNSAEPIQLSSCLAFLQHMQQDVSSFP